MAVAVLLACGLAGQGKIGFTLRRAAYPAAASGLLHVFTPDSRYIVTGSFDATLLLDVEAHKLVNRFHLDNDGTHASAGANEFKLFAVSSDGRYVASGGGPWRAIRLFDFQTGRLLRSIETNRTDICALAFSPDGKWLAAGTAYRLHDGPRPYEALYELLALGPLARGRGARPHAGARGARGRDCVPSRWKAHGLFERRGNIAALGCNDASRTQAVRDVETAGRQRRG